MTVFSWVAGTSPAMTASAAAFGEIDQADTYRYRNPG